MHAEERLVLSHASYSALPRPCRPPRYHLEARTSCKRGREAPVEGTLFSLFPVPLGISVGESSTVHGALSTGEYLPHFTDSPTTCPFYGERETVYFIFILAVPDCSLSYPP
ncbi:hypothetical protein FKM82_002459 [Ascaphus truei]